MNLGPKQPRSAENSTNAEAPLGSGASYAIACYLWWGLVPLYFKAIAHVPPWEVLAHRIVWSVVLLWTIVVLQRQGRKIFAAVVDPRSAVIVVACSVLIAANWYGFIWAMNQHRVMQASLGYFINPLVNVSLGVLLLGESLRRLQAVSVALAGGGVLLLAVWGGEVPWLALFLAGTFATYGLFRKIMRIDALTALTIETSLLLPASMAYLAYSWWSRSIVFGRSTIATDILLIAGGVITIVPLIWFAKAARSIPLSFMGMLQYISPTCQFLLSVIVFAEPFDKRQMISFSLIWVALAILAIDSILAWRSRRKTLCANPIE